VRQFTAIFQEFARSRLKEACAAELIAHRYLRFASIAFNK